MTDIYLCLMCYRCVPHFDFDVLINMNKNVRISSEN